MPFSTLPEPIVAALTEKGYAQPTSVQAAVMEPEATGRDLLVSAQTGSGKTVAFGLAMANDLLADGGPGYVTAPLALVVAPTRELALQVSKELEWLFAQARLRIVTCVGGMDPIRERRALHGGAHIVVGTPGRLRDHQERGALDLSALRFVVLDEADEMLDMGFREDLEQLLDATPETRRTFLFSATMPKPIVAMARRYQNDALRISTIDERQGHGDITYQAMAVSPSDIEHAVVNLLRFHEAETAMLFCATRDNVNHLHATLNERGFAAVALSGEHSQNERNRALQALRDGRARVCVATDVAARGIDIATLNLVVHVEIPRDAETLQHRSGRTGRAGRKGTAVLIVPYPRRRRVEMMLRGARIDAEWVPVPGADAIRERDAERMLGRMIATVEEPSEHELATAERLLAEKTPQELALALVRAHMATLPQPEDMADTGEMPERGRRREGFDEVVWFRMDIGRRQNADPRWLLPLLCRRGHVSRNEIGAIRISANQTHFQIPNAIAARFSAALARTAQEGAEDESGIHIELSPDTPREVARTNARGGNDRPQRGPRPGGSGGPRGNREGGREFGGRGGPGGEGGRGGRGGYGESRGAPRGPRSAGGDRGGY
ncbi:DEAD/DEAH box helicase [Novosphingobium sp. FSY-8]|uniref:DEAD/DEAH box helicase n=1 Tax=Novosphingobium ovatum TaxID=1908523 RepID=A0ABW9XA61_9SPHN|nr:DEAD/DEAH box helicase [Novosphingobium ovatum]NBC35418.1 DEAD/DEAH box helicase [Novosphingobium ovatum]